MPKLKTHRGTAKRIKKTGSGKLMHGHAGSNHFLRKKSSARKRAYGTQSEVDSGSQQNIKRMLS